MKSGEYLALLIACAAMGCMGQAPDVDSSPVAIVDGTPETGHPEVVFLSNGRGSCTASFISEYVVLTANHCVASDDGVVARARNLRIFVGPSSSRPTAEYRVSDVRQVADAGESGNDVALLVLATPALETPLSIGRDRPNSALPDQTMTAIGYGERPGARSGTKYTTTMGITGFMGGVIYVEPSVCHGDSGGPLIAEDGSVYGVASFFFSLVRGTEPTCGTAPAGYNEIYRHLGFIDSVLTETGTCVSSPSGEELCNASDDDCDAVVDEGCIPVGDACATDDECVGALCADTAAGRICTSECDMLRPDQGCGPGLYCGDSGGCAGHCVPGGVGTLANQEGCSANTDCASLFCFDPGDGRRRCLDPCRADAGLCYAGEVCPATPGTCGGCVPETLVSGARGLGEPCENDASCRDGMICREYGGVRECAAPCDDDSCEDGFECRDGLCITDRISGIGGICIEGPDCGEAICASFGEASWCTAVCGSAADCPPTFECTPALGTMVCSPVANLDGDVCLVDADCVSGLCASADGARFCSRICDPRDDCAAGFECRRDEASEGGLCVPAPVEEVEGGGCSVAAAPDAPAPFFAASFTASFAALFGLLVFRRRRRR